MKDARLDGVGQVGRGAAAEGGGDEGQAGKGRESRYTSQITRAPVSAESAEAAAAAAAMFSGGGPRVWGALEEEGEAATREDPEDGVHWSRRRNTEKEDQERERAVRNELLRGPAFRTSVQTVFSDDVVGGNHRLAAPHQALASQSPERAMSPAARGVRTVLGDSDFNAGFAGGASRGKKSKPQQEGFAGVVETYQEAPPALIPQSALPFSMRLDGTMPSPSKSSSLVGAKYSKREAAVSELMLAKVPSMWPTKYEPLPGGESRLSWRTETLDETGKAQDTSNFVATAGRHCGGDGELELFKHDLPEILDEVLATDKGINMAIGHFEKFVKRLELEAKRREQRLVRREQTLLSLRRTSADLAEQSARRIDPAPATWHATKSAELADIEGQTRRELLRSGELEILLKRVTYEHEQTRKALERRELDLRGYSQDVATLTVQLNESQMEAAHTFACLEKLCKTLAEQKKNMTSAALKRRALFERKADVAQKQLEAERQQRLADLQQQVRDSEKASAIRVCMPMRC